MPRFADARGAKEFLVGKIAREAEREGVPLSEIERKMLYFSETAWTLPDIAAVNEEFDRQYDPAEYEAKISMLIRHLRATDRKDNPDEFATWTEALRIIRKEDHYLLVMIDEAGTPERSAGHIMRLGIITLVGCCVALAILWIAMNR